MLQKVPPKNRWVLDVGCGQGEFGFLLKRDGKCGRLVGVDVWKPYVKWLKEMRIYDELVLADARYLPFQPDSFSLAVASEIIQHMEKQRGSELLFELHHLADNIVVSTTRLQRREEPHNNPFLRHRSSWHRHDLEQLGYTAENVRLLPWSLDVMDSMRRCISGLPRKGIHLIGTKYANPQ